ncbi:hypothetical protein [Spirosoma endophyticum]|uniref:Uncharacterized protein n=1 Tax=Spirosoma endophyticum TaxID=662367 RepID=A0A1I2HX09_9BACT|nr:hypothetical protein [Spirosoma endophyticum]SFF33287.1 hypothetical protein SAMN05216167_1494 [Spirosoma endophyticum]
MESWQHIKDTVYFEDGSLREIYVYNTNQTDWLKWVAFVNRTYKVLFYNGSTDRYEDKINPDVIISFWQTIPDWHCDATIYLRDVLVKTYFFSPEEIENDIDPKEVKSLDDHQAIVSYLYAVADTLQKPIYFTEEWSRDRLVWSVIKP